MSANDRRDRRVRVAVVFGGRSNEHAISCVSAGSILRNLDSRRFDVIAVGITPAGSWVLTDANPDALTITNRELPQVKHTASNPPVLIISRVVAGGGAARTVR